MEIVESLQNSKWSLSNIQYIQSEEEHACVIACLAMIVGKSFREVFSEMERYWKNEGQFEGTDDYAWMAYLSARGYAIQDIDHEYSPEDRLIDPWPLKPFAPIHILFVYSEGPHAVIMLSDGTILDPSNPHITSRHQYHRVYRMVGVWQVSQALPFIKTEQPTITLKSRKSDQ